LVVGWALISFWEAVPMYLAFMKLSDNPQREVAVALAIAVCWIPVIGTAAAVMCAVWAWGVPWWVAVAMYALLGVGTGLWLTLNTTLRQEITPAKLLGRMNAVFRTISWGVVPFGAAFGGLVARLFGLRTPFVIAGVAMTLIAVFARPILRPIRAVTT
jgi:MFS family permease